ncbi:MAG TPA: type II toxin-antitoxin system HicB family antitoxin [Candidatus Paceibacterota bacterium]
MNRFNLQSVIWNEGKYYVAQCLNVDVSSFGKSRMEALSNLNEAVSLYFEDENSLKIAEVKQAEIVPLIWRHA